MSDPILLEVPFQEKDQAKQLGARWNPLLRKWFVPEGLDAARFARWRTESAMPPAVSPSALDPATESELPGISLRALLNQVERTVSLNIPRAQWVRAEISQARVTAGGHLQLELIEQDTDGQLTARLPAFLWAQRLESVNQTFESATGSPLQAGLKVLFQMNVEYSSIYGLRALIEAVDPAYTLGDMVQKLESIRQLLRSLGLYDRNQRLPEPTEFMEVWVLSPKDAAGLGDFREQADRLEAFGVCRFHYFTAIFQGPEALSSLESALRSLAESLPETRADALCIIRGGGAVTDLAWLNEQALGEAVCRFPIPVLTGIGHERDHTLFDEVANRRFDTPSKVISHIAGTLYANASQAIEQVLQVVGLSLSHLERAEAESDRLKSQILNLGTTGLISAEMALTRLASELGTLAQTDLGRADAELDRHIRGMAHAVTQSLSLEMAELSQRIGRIEDLGLARLQEAEQSLESLTREILGLGPESTLRRGYLLARDLQGRPITSRKAAVQAPLIRLNFHDGALNVSPIKESEP